MRDGVFIKAHRVLWDHFSAFFYENLYQVKVIAQEGFKGVSWGRLIETTNLTMGLPELKSYFRSAPGRFQGEANDNLRFILSMLLWEKLESERDFAVAVLEVSRRSWIAGLEVSSFRKVEALQEVPVQLTLRWLCTSTSLVFLCTDSEGK